MVCNSADGTWWHARHRATRNHTCFVHASYIELPKPFMGMWISTHQQLQQFLKSVYWDKDAALSATLPHPVSLGYPERSSFFNQIVSVPAGHLSASVVPYPTTLAPSDCHVSRLFRTCLRNAYFHVSKTITKTSVCNQVFCVTAHDAAKLYAAPRICCDRYLARLVQ
jgi:hypothetical protein